MFDYFEPWRAEALCVDSPYHLPPPTRAWGEGLRTTRHQRSLDVMRAQAICRSCPVLEECAATVRRFPQNQRFGVWGGVNYGDAPRALRG